MSNQVEPIENTTWARALGMASPIVCAPMGGAAGGRLAAAVSLAGGLGMIGMGSAASVAALDRELAVLQSLLHGTPAGTGTAAGPARPPFGIGMVDWGIALHPELLDRAIAAKPTVISVSFGDWRGSGDTDAISTPPTWIAQAQAAGIRALTQVSTADEARIAADAGIDAVVARGLEGGGHGDHAVPLARLLDEVLAAIDIPVLAAGAISTAADVRRVTAAGAAAVWVGTAFAACEESLTPAAARAEMISSRGHDTVVTRVYDVALERPWPTRFPERLKPTPFVTEWHGRDAELAQNEDAKQRFRTAVESGDFTIVPVDVGLGVDFVTSVRPAADVLRELAGRDSHR